jgi:hypothetical protein
MSAATNGRVPAATQPPQVVGDRRNHPARRALVDRIRGEFLEMHGVPLTDGEIARLMGVPPAACERILSALIREGALRLNLDGRYLVADPRP